MITEHQDVMATEHGILYLKGLLDHCNNGPDGIFCRIFEYKEDEQFEKSLSSFPGFTSQEQYRFVADLFCETAIIDQLTDFSTDHNHLRAEILNASFRYMRPARVEQLLYDYLYNFGVYHSFGGNNGEAKTIGVARDFTNVVYDADPENIVCLHTQKSWGDWFDQHSICDVCFLFINKRDRFIWLLCATDSD